MTASYSSSLYRVIGPSLRCTGCPGCLPDVRLFCFLLKRVKKNSEACGALPTPQPPHPPPTPPRLRARLNDAMGACERLLRTPIPQSYTRHTSRFLTLWCNLLPLALWPALGLGTPLATVFIGFALLGIEDIGVQIEEPFCVLPLWQYAGTVADSCDELLLAAGTPPVDDGGGGGGPEQQA